MQALEVASELWGGGGFILVPHHPVTGEPSSKFAKVVRTYDPDHVVVVKVPAAVYESWYPGSIALDGVPEESREDLIRSIRHEMTYPASERAREIVASWCSPMRRARLGRDAGTRQHEMHSSISKVDRDTRSRQGLPVVPVRDESLLAASSEWRSDLGLFAAARVGVVRPSSDARVEPGPDIVEWGILREIHAEKLTPPVLMQTPETDQHAAAPAMTVFDAHPGLMQVSRGYSQDMAAVVVGDTATDFALALAYDRTIGRGFWVTPGMLDDPEVRRSLRYSLWWLISQIEQQSAFLTVSSASLDESALRLAAEDLQEPNYEFERNSRRREMVDESHTVQVREPDLDLGSYLLLEEHIGTSVVMPMSVLQDGTLEATTPLQTPVPSSLMFPADSANVPYWYVDLSFPRDATPRARDLPASSLITRGDSGWPEVNLRASKHGISFNPASMGLVLSGSLLQGRLGRPTLRSLSLRAWVEGMAKAAGLGVRSSTPGRQAELVSRRLGSRDALLDLISSSAHPLLRAFVPLEVVPKERDPGSVVIGLDPYLSFAKMSTLSGSDEAAMAVVDTLSSARLLRRGLILGCQDCGRPSFVDADRIGQHYECPQCAAMNTLVSARWRQGNEPAWHYDLYTPFRDLLSKHGDIPILAAAKLREDGRTYADVSEMEFFNLDSNNAVAEIDLIACVDDRVLVVEAKISGAFPKRARGTQTKKLIQIAEALRADGIVLATSQAAWNETDVEHLQQEGARCQPYPVAGSAMTGLGR